MSFESERLRILERVADGELTPQQGSLEIAMLKTVYGVGDAGAEATPGESASARPIHDAGTRPYDGTGARPADEAEAAASLGRLSWNMGGRSGGNAGSSGTYRIPRTVADLGSLQGIDWRQVPWPVWVAIALPLILIVGLGGLLLAGLAALVTFAVQVVWNAGLVPLMPQASPLTFFPSFWYVFGVMLLWTILDTVRRVRAVRPLR